MRGLAVLDDDHSCVLGLAQAFRSQGVVGAQPRLVRSTPVWVSGIGFTCAVPWTCSALGIRTHRLRYSARPVLLHSPRAALRLTRSRAWFRAWMTLAQRGAMIMGTDTGLREGYAEIGDQLLHYVEIGEGPLIVLLHGFPNSGTDGASRSNRSPPRVRSSSPTCADTTCHQSLTMSQSTTSASSPPTSAASSMNAAPSRPCWSVTTGAAVSRRPRR